MAIPKQLSINKFIKLTSRENGPLGGYAKDIIKDHDYPFFLETPEEVFEILELHARKFGQMNLHKEFVTAFNQNNI